MQCSDCGDTATVYVTARANDWADSDYLCDKCSQIAHNFMLPYILMDAGTIEERPIGEPTCNSCRRDRNPPEQRPEDGEGALPSQEQVE